MSLKFLRKVYVVNLDRDLYETDVVRFVRVRSRPNGFIGEVGWVTGVFDAETGETLIFLKLDLSIDPGGAVTGVAWFIHPDDLGDIIPGENFRSLGGRNKPPFRLVEQKVELVGEGDARFPPHTKPRPVAPDFLHERLDNLYASFGLEKVKEFMD